MFICDHAVGYTSLEYATSVLARDCYEYCWSKSHVIYVIFALLSLAFYIPSAIRLRPVWSDYQNFLHKTFPVFLVVKSIVQVTLICLNKTLKQWYPVVNSVLFLCISGLLHL